MEKITGLRVFLCGLLAGGVWTLLSVVLLAFVGGDFLAALQNGRHNQKAPDGGQNLFLLACNIGAGVWAMWLYSAIRQRYGPGPKTAVLAGIAWWSIVSMQSAKWVTLLAVPVAATLGPLAATLPAIVGATLAAAWVCERQKPGPVSLQSKSSLSN